MKKSCFVICPIGDDGSDARKRSDLVYSRIVEPVFGEFDYEVNRADKILHSGKITTQIVNKIMNSDMVVADLTDGNPNVYYELAIRHAIRKPFIQIAQYGTKIPFDIADMRTIFYDIDLEKGLQAIGNLRGFLKEIDNGNFSKFESPISQTIDVNTLGNSGDITERLVADLFNEIKGIKMQIQDINRSGGDFGYQMTQKRQTYDSHLNDFKSDLNKLIIEREALKRAFGISLSKKDKEILSSLLIENKNKIESFNHEINEIHHVSNSQKQSGE